MKKEMLIFAAGLAIGGVIASGIFFIAAKKFSGQVDKNAMQTTHKVSDEQNCDEITEFFSPTFSLEDCRQWHNYAEYLMYGGYKEYRTWDMAMVAGLTSFISRMELYIFMNQKARSLSGKEQLDFVAQHRQWIKWMDEEARKPVRDHDGNIIEGTMAIPIQAGYPGDLIEEYLGKFPDRAKLKYDYVAEYKKTHMEESEQ